MCLKSTPYYHRIKNDGVQAKEKKSTKLPLLLSDGDETIIAECIDGLREVQGV